tara:strand:- start:137 stop:1108 length:972 start_codon:yes stop_codon:yes gene_type:complete
MGVFEGLGKMFGGFAAASASKRAQRRAKEDKDKQTLALASLEDSRQDIMNPYENSRDLSALASDLSGKLSNPFASLGVSTAAAAIQGEQTDIALANTLDTLRATGAGAGGATALAQAALASKKGVAASIEQQEAQNERMKAQGQQSLERAELAEGQRIQQTQISEGRRVQSDKARGKAFAFNAAERRESGKINYTRNLRDQAKQRELGASAATANATGQVWGGLGSALDAPADDFVQVVGAVGGSVGGMLAASDRRLKENIKLIGKSSSGLKIYAFEYINKIFGEGVWQGVMSDEIPQIAVVKHSDGYDRVDYSKLDVEFKQI